MYFSKVLAVAASLLPLSAVAAPSSKRGASCAASRSEQSCPTDAESYCPTVCTPSTSTRESLFAAFNQQLFSGDVSGAFAKYVSSSLVEHSAGSTSAAESIGFLSALLPGVDITAPIGNLAGCRGDICFIHYKATPKGSDSLISNVTAISDFYRYDGSCIVEHWDSTQTADANTINPDFPGN